MDTPPVAKTDLRPWRSQNRRALLRKTRVNKALEDFDENLRSRVISVLEQVHAVA
jgi:hypothetical protein